MTVRQLSDLTWEELRDVAPGSIAVLPIGSQEQHGRHLPLGTDRMLADVVVDRAMEQLGSTGPELVRLPTLAYGFSPHHAFAAAVTLTSHTLAAVLGDILDSLVCIGFTRMIVVNGHGGNDETMRLAVKQAALRADIVAGACNYWEMLDDQRAGGPEPTLDGRRVPGHAGWFETSMMLAAHPELVRPRQWEPPPGPPPLFDRPPHPGLVTERHGEWNRVGGVTDDPRDADPDTGATMLSRRVAGLATAIRAFDRATAASHHRVPSAAARSSTPRKGTT